MFNVTIKGNSRCNGLISSSTSGSAKHNVHLNNNAMPPSRGHRASETKLKFSDRLKVYLSSDTLHSDNSEADDPYTFSDSEIVKAAATNHASRKSSHSRTKGEGNAVDHGRTMSRLQAQIARNKVSVKHRREDTGAPADPPERVVKRRKLPPSGKPLPEHLKARRASTKATHHEALQRINPPEEWHAPQPFGPLLSPASDYDEDKPVYQRHWFSRHLETLETEDGPREARLEVTRIELQRQLQQMRRSKVGEPRSYQNLRALLEVARNVNRPKELPTARVLSGTAAASGGPLVPRKCVALNCKRDALPCTRHCSDHIMENGDQVLFEFCTAKFADNTQCSVPVLDIAHELPLCKEHARKRDNYNRMCLETKPKKPRRKVKPSAMLRPQKRSKKRKRSQKSIDMVTPQMGALRNGSVGDVSELNVCETSSAYESSEDVGVDGFSETEITIKEEVICDHVDGVPHHPGGHIGDQDMVEQVLADVGADLELVTVEQALVTQASRLLEETDFTNVLNQIPPDEFNDLFAVDRNGEYEPSREETEELERALEAVDEDVKSLEKLSQTQGLLDSLLDEHTLVESLVQIPDVFHNGYAPSASPPAPHASRHAPAAVTFHPGMHTTVAVAEGIFPVQTHPS